MNLDSVEARFPEDVLLTLYNDVLTLWEQISSRENPINPIYLGIVSLARPDFVFTQNSFPNETWKLIVLRGWMKISPKVIQRLPLPACDDTGRDTQFGGPGWPNVKLIALRTATTR